MKLTMLDRDVKAIENGMKKYNVDSKGLLEIAQTWEQNERVRAFIEKIKTYISWGM